VTIFPLRVPIPRERINCPSFAHEPLNRGPTGRLDGIWFGDVPIHVIKVESDGGPAGWGDATRGIETQLLEKLARRLIGLAPADIDPRRELFAEIVAPRGIHTAALDWRARLAEVPLHSLFGPRIRDGVVMADWSGHRTPEGAAKLATEALGRGITCLKLKGSLETDAPGIADAIRRACPQGFNVVIDPNGRWETSRETMVRALAVRAVNPDVKLEDPLYNQNAELARVRKQTGIKMIITARGPEKVIAAHETKCADELNLSGSWPQLIAASAEATRRRLPFWVGSSVDTGLADVATIHFGVTQPFFTAPCELAGHQVREHHLLTSDITDSKGIALPPDGPGLGVDVDPAAIDRYIIGRQIEVTC